MKLPRSSWFVVACAVVSSACVEPTAAVGRRVPERPCAPPPLVAPVDPRPVLAVQLPSGFFRPDAPWPTLPRVAPVPLDTSKVRTTTVRTWSSETLAQSFDHAFASDPLPSELRGVLIAKPERPAGAPTHYAFVRGYRHPTYFLREPGGGDARRMVNRSTASGRQVWLPAAMLAPSEGERFKLASWLHLVDVEVNHGHGDAQATPGFVITKLRVLDGTEVLPIDLPAAASVLDERAQASIAAAVERAAPEVLKAEKALPAEASRVARTADTQQRADVAWDDARKELRFTYLETRRLTYRGVTRNLPTNCPRNAPCQPKRETTSYVLGLEIGVRQKLSASGVLLEETTFEPQVTSSRFTR